MRLSCWLLNLDDTTICRSERLPREPPWKSLYKTVDSDKGPREDKLKMRKDLDEDKLARDKTKVQTFGLHFRLTYRLYIELCQRTRTSSICSSPPLTISPKMKPTPCA